MLSKSTASTRAAKRISEEKKDNLKQAMTICEFCDYSTLTINSCTRNAEMNYYGQSREYVTLVYIIPKLSLVKITIVFFIAKKTVC